MWVHLSALLDAIVCIVYERVVSMLSKTKLPQHSLLGLHTHWGEALRSKDTHSGSGLFVAIEQKEKNF